MRVMGKEAPHSSYPKGNDSLDCGIRQTGGWVIHFGTLHTTPPFGTLYPHLDNGDKTPISGAQ